ncbi:YbaK/EbsC family protein [Frankia sp. R82]|uniref:YbaK/EbsC family protein n=1 Tax=Frankia sp. R82 TaxID=2950553 RepID=UPI0020434E75|nr:YbaK/EbsC family protein [Frankia sp. R82]MCM3885835.1 YbaK/EbsC family protein [Frankia sp. R82]
MSLSKRARQFQEMLDGRGLDLEVVELSDSTHTADDAARALGCAKEQIVKSLVFRNTATDGPVMVLASGPNRVDEAKIAAVLGSEIGRANAAYVKRTTGFPIGGVPPLGHREPMLLFVDEDLLQYDEVWAAAGTPNAVFRIPGKITSILDEHIVLPVT